MPGFFPDNQAKQKTIEKLLLKLPKSVQFRKHLRELTKFPHLAGTAENKAVADYIQKVMGDAGLKSVKYPYDVFLPTGPGEIAVELVTPIRMPLNNQEYILKEDPFTRQAVGPGWNSYSGSGDVTAEVVYVNYGTKEDFDKLAELGVSVRGKIVLARYGGNFRGYIAKFAEAAGAAGLILYTDPEDSGYMQGLSYPEGSYFSESTIQRGTVKALDYVGDPLTPFEPALILDGDTKIKRLDPKEVDFLSIPVTPLPYGSAKEILGRMKGEEVPQAWQGGLSFTYRLTGGAGLTVRLKVKQDKDFIRIQNIVGTLEGSSFPDEWIIMGSHYDAWVHGAGDPNSGTAMLLCVAEAFGELVKQGYRPLRTIKIAHWDAEEHGIIGCTEWVEQFRDELDAKAIAYFDADGACFGPTFYAYAAPSLKGLLVEVSKVVPYLNQEISVYDHWVSQVEGKSKGPYIGNPGGGGDHIAFYSFLGIPSLGTNMYGPSLYHSAYDDFHWYETFGDPEFQSGPTMTRIYGIMALRLANADLLPLDVGRYGTDLCTHLRTAEKAVQDYSPDYRMTRLMESVDRLAKAASYYEKSIQAAIEKGKLGPETLAQMNALLRKLERAFIDEQGLSYRKWSRSLYASSNPNNAYVSWTLPGLLYEASLRSIVNLPDLERRYLAAFERLKKDIENMIKLLEK